MHLDRAKRGDGSRPTDWTPLAETSAAILRSAAPPQFDVCRGEWWLCAVSPHITSKRVRPFRRDTSIKTGSVSTEVGSSGVGAHSGPIAGAQRSAFSYWPVTGDRWPLTGDHWPLTADRALRSALPFRLVYLLVSEVCSYIVVRDTHCTTRALWVSKSCHLLIVEGRGVLCCQWLLLCTLPVRCFWNRCGIKNRRSSFGFLARHLLGRGCAVLFFSYFW